MTGRGNGNAHLTALTRPEGNPSSAELSGKHRRGDMGARVGPNRVTAEDAPTVQRLCRLEDEAATLRELMAKDGPTLRRPVQSSRGAVIGEECYSHPALADQRRIGKEAAALCAELGLSPAGRHKLGLPVLAEPEPEDALDRLRARREARLKKARGSETWRDDGPGVRDQAPAASRALEASRRSPPRHQRGACATSEPAV